MEERLRFVARLLDGEGMSEIYALSRGTSCKQFMYSLSVNPPPREEIGTSDILDAIERTEKNLA
ncbi:MAG: hypothetical protein AAF530_18480 [Pseudomonadota bacterium]